MAKKSSQASEERRDYWRAAIELQQSSGLSIREFCSTEGLAESAFYHWRQELASPSPQKKQGQPAAPKFVPVEIDTASSLVVELPSGTRLNVGQGCSPELLRTVLELLPC